MTKNRTANNRLRTKEAVKKRYLKEALHRLNCQDQEFASCGKIHIAGSFHQCHPDRSGSASAR